MPKCTVLQTLVKEGVTYPVGSEIELTKEEFEFVGEEKAEEIEFKEEFVPGEVYEEAEYRALGADEQKKVVEQYGGDLKEITNAEARWAFVEANQQ